MNPSRSVVEAEEIPRVLGTGVGEMELLDVCESEVHGFEERWMLCSPACSLSRYTEQYAACSQEHGA